MKICLLFITIFFYFIPKASSSDKIVKVATLHDYEPFCFSEKFTVEVISPGKNSISLKGYSWDIVRNSYHHMGYTIELHVLPWPRALYPLGGRA